MKHAAYALLIATVICLAGRSQGADALRPRPDTFDSAGVKIAYVEAGQGEPVVLVHGLYSSAEMNWVAPGTFRLLAANHRVIALDLRGHGKSDKPTDDASYGQPMVEEWRCGAAWLGVRAGRSQSDSARCPGRSRSRRAYRSGLRA